jgi:hypothetical protein
VAAAFTLHRGVLCLPSVATLSVATARALAMHQGGLVLSGLTTLGADAARALGGHAGMIELYTLTQTANLDSIDVAALLTAKNPALWLPNVLRIDAADSVAIAGTLARSQGSVSLPNLKAASPATVAALLAGGNVAIPPLETIEMLSEPSAGQSPVQGDVRGD